MNVFKDGYYAIIFEGSNSIQMEKFREAWPEDFEAIHHVRMSVKENVLSNPALVTRQHYINMLTEKGKGWLCESDQVVIGFAIIDVSSRNIWALFVHPEHEKKGIGKRLHDMMLSWYFMNSIDELWLTTSPGTRAEQFYMRAGWERDGWVKDEIKFKINKDRFFAVTQPEAPRST
jgi:GNAT superfamily N-acetyltransferase